MSDVGAVGALGALWGLAGPPPAEETTLSVGTALRRTTIHLGGGPRLLTRAGIDVRLPLEGDESAAAMAMLERWALELLSERYTASGTAESRLLRVYYAVRPILPRGFQLWLRRRHARRRTRVAPLAWPVDGTFAAFAEAFVALWIRARRRSTADVIPFWPAGYDCAVTLTHDVEGVEGQARCRDVAALERQRGLRSCFNFVAERYRLDEGLLEELRKDGFEIGVHGIRHDGRKFSNRRVFEERLVLLRRYQEAWHASGFRSPATHRRWEWMHELPFDYDSSYPDTDPYEPIAGGCGSPWPFLIGSLVELPVTLPQDHTLWEILQRSALPTWREKRQWLMTCGGLINIIVHPDYLRIPERWREYEAFLDDLNALHGVWTALPRDVARWWRTRDQEPRRRVELMPDASGALVLSTVRMAA